MFNALEVLIRLIRNSRFKALCGIVAGIAGVLVLARLAYTVLPETGSGNHLSDLDTYRGALTALRGHRGLYSYHAPGSGDAFNYPPLAALILLPLSFLSVSALDITWTILSIGCAIMIAVITGRHVTQKTSIADQTLASGVFLLVLALSAPMYSNLRLGQVSMLVSGLVLVDVLLLREKRCAGVLIGLAAAFKLTPLIFIPFLWLTGKRPSAVRAVLTFVLATALGWLALPADSARYWLAIVANGSDVSGFTMSGNSSVQAELMRYGLGSPWVTLLWAVVSVVVAFTALGFSVWTREHDTLSAVTIVGAASVVISPISWTHHLVWLILAAAIPVTRSLVLRIFWAVAVLSIMLGPLTAARPYLAITVALVIPLIHLRRRPEKAKPSSRNGEPEFVNQTAVMS